MTALQELVYDLSVDVHGDYIEDAEGNRIDADLSFTNPNWTGWRIDGSGELLKGTKDLANDNYMYPDPQEDDKYYQISFDNQTSTWSLYMFYWTGDSWGTERSDTASGTIDDTTIEFTGWKTLVQESTNKTIATTDEIPTKVSQLQNDSGFITSAEVAPYHDVLTPNVNTGVAKQAMSIALREGSTNLKPDSALAANVETNRDLTDDFTALMEYVTYYPYNLEKYFEQTFSPALELKFCNDRIAYMAGSIPRIIYTGYMFRTGGAGFAMPCSEDGTPDGRLYETTNVTNTAVIIADQTTSLHQLTFTSRYNDPYGQVATIDGQSEQMTCWRTNALKMFVVSEELANKSDLPTKTSDLTNDSGFITSAQIPTPDKIEDLSANIIYANRTVQYIEEVANWTDVNYPADPLNWDAENNWWMSYVSPSFYMKLQYNNAGTWTFETGENIGGEWFIDSDYVQDTQ